MLEDETDRTSPEVGQLVIAERGGVLAVDLDAAGARRVDAADEVEQGRLAAPEGPTIIEKRWGGMSRLMPFTAFTSTAPAR